MLTISENKQGENRGLIILAQLILWCNLQVIKQCAVMLLKNSQNSILDVQEKLYVSEILHSCKYI